MKALRYKWLRWRGYRIDEIVAVRLWDDLFSNPPQLIRTWSKLRMRRGLSARSITFRRMSPEQLDGALRND